jgi:dynein heavy chain
MNLVALSRLPPFSDLLGLIIKQEKLWRVWLERDAPESEPLPAAGLASLTPFQRLLVLRSFSPDRTIAASKQYIEASMVKGSLECSKEPRC